MKGDHSEVAATVSQISPISSAMGKYKETGGSSICFTTRRTGFASQSNSSQYHSVICIMKKCLLYLAYAEIAEINSYFYTRLQKLRHQVEDDSCCSVDFFMLQFKGELHTLS